eukprot:gene8451-276_t
MSRKKTKPAAEQHNEAQPEQPEQPQPDVNDDIRQISRSIKEFQNEIKELRNKIDDYRSVQKCLENEDLDETVKQSILVSHRNKYPN